MTKYLLAPNIQPTVFYVQSSLQTFSKNRENMVHGMTYYGILHYLGMLSVISWRGAP